MMRMWIGLALLSVSWLLGQGYFLPAVYCAWVGVVVLGTLLMTGALQRLPSAGQLGAAALLLAPAVLLLRWPERVGPLLVLVGAGLATANAPRGWIGRVGRGAMAAGVVLMVQALSMAGYAAYAGRDHDLPGPLLWLLTGVARLLGIDAAADGSHVVLHSMRTPHRLAATWELLLDPATFCFYLGGVVLLAMLCWSRLPGGRRWTAWIAGLRTLTMVIAVWLPVRAGLLMGLYLHRAIRFEPERPLHVMNQFFSPWVLLGLLAVPVLLAWRFVRLPSAGADAATGDAPFVGRSATPSYPSDASSVGRSATPSYPSDASSVGRSATPSYPSDAADQPEETESWRLPAAAGLVFLGAGLLTAAVHYDPVGSPKGGRVMVVERHSTWEPTTRPYDTTWFGHDSGYNYAAAYDYLGQYFEMSRLLESDAIDDETLGRCDVLVIKTPTERYAPEEVEAVVRFVQRGGGVLFVGDHTNVFRGGTIMNDMTRRFGFIFRDDLLFGFGESPYRQTYRAPRVPHPIVQHLPPMNFAVSCSIDPGRSRGRAAIRAAGLWSLPPDYHIENFHTIPQHRPDMRFGTFVQLWSTRQGKGRVLAFTDSTIFSSFCLYQPGKAELLRGMVDWFNRRNALGDPRWWLVILGLIPLSAGLWLAHRCQNAWLVLLATAACGFALSGQTIAALNRRARPIPEATNPLPRVVIDRTTSDAPLAIGLEPEVDTGQGYAMLEAWIPRLGCYTTRQSGPKAFSGDMLVVICPERSISPEFREGVERYVAEGGKLLLIDTPENAASTADSLLWPFGISLLREQPWQGLLSLGEGWPNVRVELAYEVAGGEPVARLGPRAVAAVTEYGKGKVMVIGFGSLFNDLRMANGQLTDYPWMLEPDEETLRRYHVLFALAGSLLYDRPVGPPPGS